MTSPLSFVREKNKHWERRQTLASNGNKVRDFGKWCIKKKKAEKSTRGNPCHVVREKIDDPFWIEKGEERVWETKGTPGG